MHFNFSVVVCKKKNLIWGSVVDGRFQPSGVTVLSRTLRLLWHSLGSAQHGHPSSWKCPSTTEPHIRFLYYSFEKRKFLENLADPHGSFRHVHYTKCLIKRHQGDYWGIIFCMSPQKHNLLTQES